jgi:splicing factor 3A subunit 3
MYAKQSVYDAHLTSKKHLKASEKLTASGQTNGVKSNGTASTAPVAPTPSTSQPSAKREKERVIARLEHLIAALLAVPTLAQMRKDTKSNVERRQALTDGERMLELEEMEERERKEAEEAAAAAERKAKKGGADDEEEEVRALRESEALWS